MGTKVGVRVAEEEGDGDHHDRGEAGRRTRDREMTKAKEKVHGCWQRFAISGECLEIHCHLTG